MKQAQFLSLLGSRITLMRVNANLTQLQLAKRVKLSRTQITNLEAGRSNTTIWRLAQICAACNCELSDLLKR